MDVGAHIGLVSVLAAKRFNAKKVISFEPCSNNFEFLKKNKEINNCQNILINKLALSNKEGETKLYLRGSGTHSIIEEYPGSGFEVVKLVTLDKALKEEVIIDLLKIDVEGAEVDVLKGAGETLKKTRKVVIEYSNLTYGEVIDILKKNGFNLMVRKNIIIAERNLEHDSQFFS